MNRAQAFARLFFVILSIFFMTAYMISKEAADPVLQMAKGIGLGIGLAALLMGFDFLFRRFNLRAFNIAMLGLFFGYLMGQALVLIFSAILKISAASIALLPQTIEAIEISLFLFGLYLGTLLTLKASDEFYISIPFVRFSPTAQKKKDLLLDFSALADPRVLDLVSSGLLDHHLIAPRFLIKELYLQAESPSEGERTKAKRALDILKKLESLPDAGLRYHETDFPEVKDPMGKMIRLARLLDANILTADLSRIQISAIEGIRIINLHNLSNALKPLMQTGEQIKIKIQRYGKEPRQGVGYLEDGTMVVVNGGGDYIGEVIEAKVLSVKHTSSGRMIFCNAPDESEEEHEYPSDEEEEP